MPYTIQPNPELVENLVTYSQRIGASAIDIAPIIQNADNLMTTEALVLGGSLIADGIYSGIEYARNKPSKAIKELNKNRY